MKKLIRIVLTIQFALMLAHCTTSTDNLYREYAACREQTLHPKVTETGVVVVNKDGSPVMIYTTGACPDELSKWETSHVLREKRRREREAYSALTGSCGTGAVLMCSGRVGVSSCIGRDGTIDKHCSCGCVRNSVLNGMINRRW